MPKKRKIGRSLIGAIFLPFTLLVFAPLDNYLLAPKTYIFSASNILSAFIPLFLLSAAFLFLLLLFLPETFRKYFVAFLFVLNAVFYLHGNFLDNNYSVLNGEAIDWSTDIKHRNVSIATIIICIAVTLVLIKLLKKKDFEKVLLTVALICAGMQTASCLTLAITQNISLFSTKARTSFSKEGMFELSSDTNTLLFLVDTLDTDLMNEYLDTNDASEKEFENFTFYDNCISISGATTLSVPFMLTDELYMHDMTKKEYGELAYNNSEFLHALEDRGYDIGIYGTSSYLAYYADAIKLAINNVQLSGGQIKNNDIFLKAYGKLLAFRYMPQPLKRFFFIYSDDVNTEDIYDLGEAYSVYDPQFYLDYCNAGLSISTDRPVFRFYHLRGAHPPYVLGANAEKVENGTQFEQLKGVFKIIREYIAELKELGLYDKTNIVILGDHGCYGDRTRTAVLIKRAGTKSDFVRDSSPLSFKNSLKNTLLELIGAESKGSSFFHPAETDTRSAWTTCLYKTDAERMYVTFEVNVSEEDKHVITGNTSPATGAGLDYVLGTRMDALFFRKWTTTSINTYRSDGMTELYGPYTIIPLELKEIPNEDLCLTMEFEIIDNYPGTVHLNVNGHDAGIASVDMKSKELSFSIAKEWVKEKALVLQLFFDGNKAEPGEMLFATRSILVKSLWIDVAVPATSNKFMTSKMILGYAETSDGSQVTDGVLSLGENAGARSWYVNYPAGTYRIVASGNSIDLLEIRPIYYVDTQGNIEPEVTIEEHTENTYIQYFILDENAKAVTLMLWNTAQKEIEVQELSIEAVH